MMWKKAWVDGLDSPQQFSSADYFPEPYHLIQNEGRGLLKQGARDWKDCRVSARLTPHMCRAGGIAVRCKGGNAFYALLLDREKARLIRTLDDDTVLAEIDCGWAFFNSYDLTLQIVGNKLTGSINGEIVIEAEDPDCALEGGGIALISEEGHIACHEVAVCPI